MQKKYIIHIIQQHKRIGQHEDKKKINSPYLLGYSRIICLPRIIFTQLSILLGFSGIDCDRMLIKNEVRENSFHVCLTRPCNNVKQNEMAATLILQAIIYRRNPPHSVIVNHKLHYVWLHIYNEITSRCPAMLRCFYIVTLLSNTFQLDIKNTINIHPQIRSLF